MDAQGRVTVYNRRLLEMLDLPDELMSRQPTQDEVVAFQTARGDVGVDYGLVEPGARRYVEADAGPVPDRYMRRTSDGRALEIHNRPLARRWHGAHLLGGAVRIRIVFPY